MNTLEGLDGSMINGTMVFKLPIIIMEQLGNDQPLTIFNTTV